MTVEFLSGGGETSKDVVRRVGKWTETLEVIGASAVLALEKD